MRTNWNSIKSLVIVFFKDCERKIIEIKESKFPNLFSRTNIMVGIPMIMIVILIAVLGQRQVVTNRIKQGKLEYHQQNWRSAFRILFDNRHSFAFDKEACRMLGCMLRNGYGDPFDKDEGATYWLKKAGTKDCTDSR